MTTTIAEREVALIDLLDRLLGGGVVIAGDITLSAADVDLVYVGLRALVHSSHDEFPHGKCRPATVQG